MHLKIIKKNINKLINIDLQNSLCIGVIFVAYFNNTKCIKNNLLDTSVYCTMIHYHVNFLIVNQLN